MAYVSIYQQPVNLESSEDHMVFGKALEEYLAGTLTKSLTQGSIHKQTLERLCHQILLGKRYEKSAHTMGNSFRDAADTGRDDGQTSTHRFENADRKRFVEGAEDKNGRL